VLIIPQMKFWLNQSQWEFSQELGFQTIIPLQRLAQSSIRFISRSDFICGEWVFWGGNTRVTVPLSEYTRYRR